MAYKRQSALPVAEGGTGLTTATAHDLMVGAGTSAFSLVAPNATVNVPFVSKGAAADPNYSLTTVIDTITTSSTGTTTLNICNDATNNTVNVGTGAGVKTIVIGSTNSTSDTTVQSGSTGITVTSATANGPISIVSGTGTIGIATSATNSTVNIATGAGVKTTTLGSTNTTSKTTVNFGTGGYFLASATGNVMTALSSGECNYPLQPAFLATLNTTTTNVTGNNTLYTVVFDTEVFDQNADWNGTTFTAPVNGRYGFMGTIELVDLTTSFLDSFLELVTSNRTYISSRMSPVYTLVPASGYLQLHCAWFTDMDAGDTTVLAVQVDGSTKTIDVVGGNEYSYFSGSLVC